MQYRLSDTLKDPKTILEIVNAGIERPDLATNAIAEILEQLYKQDRVKVLITIDDYNTWLKPSCFLSFRYENQRDFNGRIPPYHLALCRLFIKFDGHFIRNGVKLCATTHKH